ncbi:GNAT family N-acetyltransferase [Streptomyces sp. 061-3]|uniref:GNAT family N-acetyltransferase n=1 Tax=Streptomyces sp. 061-3 TaxID=2789268 RepID=UPI00397F7099
MGRPQPRSLPARRTLGHGPPSADPPRLRGRGIGSALVHELRKIARDELGLEQLHLAARGGEGLEDFYGRLGWREIGRWPAALRLAPDDTRDEVLMILAPL